MHLTRFRAPNATLKFKERLRVITRGSSCLSRNESLLQHEPPGGWGGGYCAGGLPERAAFFSNWRLTDRISRGGVWKRVKKLPFRYLKCFSNRPTKRLVHESILRGIQVKNSRQEMQFPYCLYFLTKEYVRVILSGWARTMF